MVLDSPPVLSCGCPVTGIPRTGASVRTYLAWWNAFTNWYSAFLNRLWDELQSVRLRHLVVYMGLEVGGCSLFADPSGYVGTDLGRCMGCRASGRACGSVVSN